MIDSITRTSKVKDKSFSDSSGGLIINGDYISEACGEGAHVGAAEAAEVKDDFLEDGAGVAADYFDGVAAGAVDVEGCLVDAAVAQGAFKPGLGVFHGGCRGVHNRAFVDTDAVFGLRIGGLVSGISAVVIEREGRENVGVDVDRALVECVEIILQTRGFGAIRALLRTHRVTNLNGEVLAAKIRHHSHADGVVLLFAVETGGINRDISVVFNINRVKAGQLRRRRIESGEQHAAGLPRTGDVDISCNFIPDGNIVPIKRHLDAAGSTFAGGTAELNPGHRGGCGPFQRLLTLAVNIDIIRATMPSASDGPI